MCRVQTVVLWLCLSLSLCVFTQGEVNECTVSSDRVLTTFSGETVTLNLPCKYRMADFTCGDYRVKVTPGNGLMTSDSSFTPVTAWVNVKNKVTKVVQELRIARKRLEEGWKNIESTDAGLDFVGYDESQKLAAVRKDGVFDVQFTADGDVTVTCHTDSFDSKPGPESLCGTEGEGNPIEMAAASMGISKESLVNSAILQNDKVTQSKTCVNTAAMFQGCDDTNTALRHCEVITDVTTPQSQCLATSDTPLSDLYSDCLTAVCTEDDSLLAGINTFISENCDGVGPIGQDTSEEEGAVGEEAEDELCASEDWDRKQCSSNDDCPTVDNSVCLVGERCSCSPGYYYSESSRCCVETCSEFSDRTGKKEGYSVAAGTITSPQNLLSKSTVSHLDDITTMCYEPCAADPACLTINFVIQSEMTCMLYSVTPRDTDGVTFEPDLTGALIVMQKKCK